jgi:hypothetical protein
MTKETMTTPAFTNAQVDALVAAARAASDADKADGKVVRAAAALADAGVSEAMLKPDAPTYAKVRAVVGETILSAKDQALFFDTALAQKIKDPNDATKRILTPCGRVHQRVTMAIARIRKAIGVDAEGRAARTVKHLKQRITDNVGALVKAVTADATVDAPVFEAKRRTELLAAFQRVLDLAK